MLYITDTAQEHFARLLTHQEQGTQIRIFLINPGTPMAECGISYCPPDAVESTDIKLEFKKLSAFIDNQSVPYFIDAEIDLVTSNLNSQLTIKAPNAKIKKTENDQTPLVERIENLLRSNINPKLAGHGGHVTLIEVTDEKLAILRFGGGCNGCSMVNVTLKEGIEKELLMKLPELKGVLDITEHQRSKHSYF